jgi:hypothetical protein
MAVTSLALSDSSSPDGDEHLVGGGEFHRAETIEDELDRDLGVVHRCSQPAVNSPHAAGFRWDIVKATTCTSTVAPDVSAVCVPG